MRYGKQLLFCVVTVALALSVACSVKVDKTANGSNKDDVDIKTPVGSVSVHQNGKPQDTGIEVYANALPTQDKDDDQAQVALNLPGFGLKVATANYESADSPEKVLAFYRSSMNKRFGKFIECHGNFNVSVSSGKDSDHFNRPVSCDNKPDGNTTELKTGTEGNQHIVAISPNGKGCKIQLVFVKLHTKDDQV